MNDLYRENNSGDSKPVPTSGRAHRGRWLAMVAVIVALVGVGGYLAFGPHGAGGAGGGGSGGGVLSRLLPNSRQKEHDVIFAKFTGDKRERVVKNEQEWLASAGFVEAPTAPERIDDAISQAPASVDDPAQLLSQSDLDALLATIRAHALSRSEQSPERYLELCQDESSLYDWIPIADNAPMIGFMKYWGLDTSPEQSPQEALGVVWSQFLDEKGDRFDAIGTPPMGIRIVVRNVRTEEQSHEQFFVDGVKENYWTGEMMLTNAQRFRKPRRPIEELLKDRPGVVVAQCLILVRMANGYPINWISSWMRDPQTGRWVNSWMAYKRARLTTLVF